MKSDRATMSLVRAVVICAVFGLTTANTHGSASSVNVSQIFEKVVGETALFNITRDPAPYTYLSWKILGADFPIITVNASVNSTDPSYVDRITLLDDGSLELRNVTLEDDATYIVWITSTEDPEFLGLFILDVVEPVSNVRLLLPADLIEGHLETLTCSSASGSDVLFSFYNGSQTIMKDSKFSEYTLTVSRYDTGPFRCEAYNSFNRVSSEEVHVTLSYGPDVELKAVPFEVTYAEGSSVTLVCAVHSKPEAEISWSFEHDHLPFSGTELLLEDLTSENEGLYGCRAYNPKADQYGSSYEDIYVEHKHNPHDDGLSVGVSIAIAFVCGVVGAALVGGLVYLYQRKKKRGER